MSHRVLYTMRECGLSSVPFFVSAFLFASPYNRTDLFVYIANADDLWGVCIGEEHQRACGTGRREPGGSAYRNLYPQIQNAKRATRCNDDISPPHTHTPEHLHVELRSGTWAPAKGERRQLPTENTRV